MPPQSGKTTIVIKLFIAYLLGRLPDKKSLIATYASDLSTSHSEDTMTIMKSERYQALFGRRAYSEQMVEISRESAAKSFWRIKDHAGSVTAVGVGGAAIGKSFDYIAVDDPYKNIQEAKSSEQRKKVSKWFSSTVLSRRKKGTAIVLIHTRWDKDDLIGEQVRNMVSRDKAIQWRIVSIPALPLEAHEYAASTEEQREGMKDGLYQPLEDPLGREAGSGVSFCPDLFSETMLEEIRETLDADGELSTWFAMYQEKPRPEEGDFFARKDIKLIDESKLPTGLVWFRYIDLALGKSKRSDWNACLAIAVDEAGNIYGRDMVRIHNFVHFTPLIKQVMLMEHETVFGVESNNFQELAFRDFINDPELAGVAILPILATNDKESDARVLQARAKVGKLYFVMGEWTEDAINEFIEFPTGKHDDQVDTASRGVKMAFLYGGRRKRNREARSYQG